jgi:glycosyltransferase involved in cell wall biosynthesis
MAGDRSLERLCDSLQLRESVWLIPPLNLQDMARLFRSAAVTVSPSIHDGTPNTLLEAMASGCFPVAGDLESIREWITHGVNGLLCDPREPESIAQMIIRALSDSAMRSCAVAKNLDLVGERADRDNVMTAATAFYRRVLS